MAEDIRLAKGEDVDAIKSELAKKVNTATLESEGYLKRKIMSKLPADETNERTIYIIPEGTAFAEYIYIDGKSICLGKSDIVDTVNNLLKRVEALENK